MKKGLNVTLMTVAIAVMAFQAMAMAPIIGDIKDPIVGKNTGVTNATAFVYPDAIDLTASATDDSTSSVNIRWSYWYTGSEVYRINNVAKLADAAVADPTGAVINGVSSRINGTTDDPVTGKDSNTATITIRNTKYAPIGTTGAAAPSGLADVTPVTLFASDGTTYSSTTVIFYTDGGGNNRLSPEGTATPTQVIPPQTHFPTDGTRTWNWNYLVGTISSATNASAAVCINSGMAGVNFASWTTNFGYFSVAKNQVYRIRARINGTQTTAGTSPFFDLVLGNNDDATGGGFTLFGGDFMVFDNEGGANAPMLKAGGDAAGTVYNWYWTPACVNNDAYNNNTTLWSAANADKLKMYLMFRVMDIDTIPAQMAGTKGGTLCLNNMQIDSMPYQSLTYTSLWSSPATLSATNMQFVDYVGSAAIDTGKIKITPNAASATSTYGQAAPGNGDTSTDAQMDDDYPIAWEANTLYRIAWQWSAADTTSANAPMDVIWTAMDCPSYEFIQESYLTSKVAGFPAMPKAGTPQDYVAFFYSHNVGSSTGNAHRQRWRPRTYWANTPVVPESASTGIFYIHGCKVDKVTGF